MKRLPIKVQNPVFADAPASALLRKREATATTEVFSF